MDASRNVRQKPETPLGNGIFQCTCGAKWRIKQKEIRIALPLVPPME